jgi:hypothetical protein
VTTTAGNGKSLMPSPADKQSEAKMPIKTSRAEYDNAFGFERDIAKLEREYGMLSKAGAASDASEPTARRLIFRAIR